jgi:hypothetical protein
MVEVKVYVEGGGDAERLKRACREGFSEFFRKAGLQDAMPRVVACGGRGQAMDRFRTAVQQDDATTRSALLVDSEDPVQGTCSGATAIAHLDTRDRKNLRPVTTDEKCHLMVQVMETWFMADHKALADYFGQGFNGNGLYSTNLEGRTKREVFAALYSATRHSRKGAYGKGAHSFELLGRIDVPAVLRQCKWAARLVLTLRELKQGQQPSMP